MIIGIVASKRPTSGGGGSGSAATWDPANKGTDVVLSNGDRDANIVNNSQLAMSSLGVAPGERKYCEIELLSFNPGGTCYAITGAEVFGANPNGDASILQYYANDGSIAGGGSGFATGDVGDRIGLDINNDVSTPSIGIYKNGVFQATRGPLGTGQTIAVAVDQRYGSGVSYKYRIHPNAGSQIYSVSGSVPLAADPTVPPDPFIADVLSILEFEGADGSTAIVDEMGTTWQSANSPALTDDTRPYGTTSLYLNGTTQFLNTLSALAGTNVGTGDYTEEIWAASDDNVNSYQALMQFNDFELSIVMKYLALYEYYEGGQRLFTSAQTNKVWQHIAHVRKAGVSTLWVNGELQKRFSDNTAAGYPDTVNFGSAGKIHIGLVSAFSSTGFKGWIKGYRATKAARYDAPFAPIPAPYSLV